MTSLYTHWPKPKMLFKDSFQVLTPSYFAEFTEVVVSLSISATHWFVNLGTGFSICSCFLIIAAAKKPVIKVLLISWIMALTSLPLSSDDNKDILFMLINPFKKLLLLNSLLLLSFLLLSPYKTRIQAKGQFNSRPYILSHYIILTIQKPTNQPNWR